MAKIPTILKLAAAAVVIAGLALGSTLAFGGAAEEDKDMNAEQGKGLLTLRVPPIDASVPTETETATFALG